MSSANPEPWSEAVRLAEIISDARGLLGQPVTDPEATSYHWAARCGQLEAMLRMLADSAEIACPDHRSKPRAAGGSGG